MIEVDQFGELEAESRSAAGQPHRVGESQAAPEVDTDVDAHATCAGGSSMSSSHATAWVGITGPSEEFEAHLNGQPCPYEKTAEKP